jgi:serine/threonine protein phosphatase PrpC
MSFDLDIGYQSLAGMKPENQDFAAILQGDGLDAGRGIIAAIADGVSTGEGGAEAAQLSVNSVLNDYFETPATWDTSVALERLIAAQNSWLVSINKRRPTHQIGLTTLTALVLRGQSYTLAHVGDTRAYLLRAGVLEQLTQDHVVPNVDLSHQLTRCIGLEDRLLVDFVQGELQAGDAFILLSDGVHGTLSNKFLGTTALKFLPSAIKNNQLEQSSLVGSFAQELSNILVNNALERGSTDNVTALVVHVRGAEESTLHDESRRATTLNILPLLKTGERVDGLVVTAVVADSGVYRLYQVRDPVTQRLYALKTLRPERAHDRQELLTLAHEAWVAKRMQTGPAAKQLVRLNDWPALQAASSLRGGGSEQHTLTCSDYFYLLYDWHSGETLEQIIKSSRNIELSQIIYWMQQATRTLGYLHRQGVVHRDVKPANLHWGDDGVLRLLDLGVAITGREPASTRALHAGSASYMNPEQWPGYIKYSDREGEVANQQSDLYAVGVTLYQLLSKGKLPYGEVLPYQIGRYSKDPLPPSRYNPQVPIWLDHIALKAVARQASQRFETGEEMVLALERGASRALPAPMPSSLMQRDPTAAWKLLVGISALLNAVLIYWLLFLPK